MNSFNAGIGHSAAVDVATRIAKHDGSPLTSWWAPFRTHADPFFAWLHEHEEDRIRRKPSFGREEK